MTERPDPLTLDETAGEELVVLSKNGHLLTVGFFGWGGFVSFWVLVALVLVLGFWAGRATAAPRSAAQEGPSFAVPAAPASPSTSRPELLTGAPAPTSEPLKLVTQSGIASTYGPGYDGLTAARAPRGTVLQICGPGGCATRTVNDYGPDPDVFPERIVDLDVATFELVCAASWRMGLCNVTWVVVPRAAGCTATSGTCTYRHTALMLSSR